MTAATSTGRGQGEEAIGRATWNLENREKEFIELEGKPNGLALDGRPPLLVDERGNAAQPRQRPLPLRRRQGRRSSDLTPDAQTTTGPKCRACWRLRRRHARLLRRQRGPRRGGSGAAGGLQRHRCAQASGQCSLYLWHDGAISFVARLNADGGEPTDALNWRHADEELFGAGQLLPEDRLP